MKKRNYIFILAVFALLGASWPFSWLFYSPNPEALGTTKWLDKEIDIIRSQASNIDQKVLRLQPVPVELAAGLNLWCHADL